MTFPLFDQAALPGEQWRLGTADRGADRLDFQYNVTAPDLTSGTWSDVNALDFLSPTTAASIGALDGQNPANRTSITGTIAGLSIAPGTAFAIRWMDFNASGADDGLAVDDFTITPHAGGAPMLSVNDVSIAEGNTDTFTATFTVTVSNASHPGVTFDVATADGIGSQAATAADSEGVGIIANDDEPPSVPTDVVISQIYGGGGNAGATLTHDFIELFNRGESAVSLDGWSVQYSSAARTGTWQVTPLGGFIAPGAYYLIQEARGTGGTEPLPTPDAAGTVAMAAGAGKVALQVTTEPIVGQCPSGLTADLVGYGFATCFEGTGSGTPPTSPSVSTKIRSGFSSNRGMQQSGVPVVGSGGIGASTEMPGSRSVSARRSARSRFRRTRWSARQTSATLRAAVSVG